MWKSGNQERSGGFGHRGHSPVGRTVGRGGGGHRGRMDFRFRIADLRLGGGREAGGKCGNQGIRNRSEDMDTEGTEAEEDTEDGSRKEAKRTKDVLPCGIRAVQNLRESSAPSAYERTGNVELRESGTEDGFGHRGHGGGHGERRQGRVGPVFDRPLGPWICGGRCRWCPVGDRTYLLGVVAMDQRRTGF